MRTQHVLAGAMTMLVQLGLAACAGNTGTSAETTIVPASATTTAAAPVASATPSLAPVIGITDPEGDAPAMEADIVSAEAYVDGELLVVVLHIARLSEDPKPTEFTWGASVWPDGRFGTAPPFSMSTQPGWPPTTLQVYSLAAASAGSRQQTATWPGLVTVDRAQKTVQLAARIPGLQDAAAVSPGTNSRIGASSPPADQVLPFAATKRAISLAGRVAMPIVLTNVAPGFNEGTMSGFPAVLVAPATWRWYTNDKADLLEAISPTTTGLSAVGSFVRQLRAGETPADVLNRLVTEVSDGYVRLPDDGFALPGGFESGLIVRTATDIEAPSDPTKVLSAWHSRTGAITRFLAGRAGDSVVVAYYESDVPAGLRQDVALLGRARIEP